MKLNETKKGTFIDHFRNSIDCSFFSYRRNRFRVQPQTTSNIHQSYLVNSDTLNDVEFVSENSVLGAALTKIMSSTLQNTANQSLDETRPTPSEGVSIVSVPKNVKFLIPLGRSGLASNESTFGVIESTTRTITHVKDIFPLKSPPINNGDESGDVSSSSVFENGRRQDQNEIIRSESEQPLLENTDGNQN